MSSLLAREEPLLKQLVRSRACKRKDPLSLGFGPQIRNTRSFSQPPPRQRESAPHPHSGTLTPPNKLPASPGSPGTTYTLQFLPYSLVCQTSSVIPLSFSQPDLRKCGFNPVQDLSSGFRGFCTPPGSSRCSSISPVRCISPAGLTMSPRNGSCYSTRPGTPTRACSPGASRPSTPTIMINSEELFYAGGPEYFSASRHSPEFSAFSQKPGSSFHKINTSNWTTTSRDRASPSRDDIRRSSIAASLEVERSEARKYSLTDSIVFPRQQTPDRDRSPLRDNNNNVGNIGQQYFSGQSYDSTMSEKWVSSPCCCFNDLCCKVCLVFNKEDSSLTLEQLQNRAIENIMRQKKSGSSAASTAACMCDDCKPRSSQISQNSERSVVSAVKTKTVKKSPDSLQKKVGSLSRYRKNY